MSVSRLVRPALAVGILVALAGIPPLIANAATARVDLRVLVVTDKGVTTTAIARQLATEGVPHTTVDLTSATRPKLTAAFLADTVSGRPRAKYQAVVLPNEAPFSDAAEMAALVSYEKQFGIRQVDASVYPTPAIGLNYPHYVGSLDGITAAVSPAGLAGPFGYLRGPVPFEDNSPHVGESYGYLATPQPDDPATGSHFETLVSAPSPGDGQNGVLVGVHTRDGRSELVLNVAYNDAQEQFRLLAHGIITWMTKGVHLGYQRNYFAVHVDDVFLPDSRWSVAGHCTPGDDCPPPAPGTTPLETPDIRMTPADVTHAKDWQDRQDFTFDMYFNAAGSDETVEEHGSDPLTTAFLANKGSFRWGNHTYSHAFLGCVQDFTVTPWRCATTSSGYPQYVGKAEITDQITRNKTWAGRHGLPLDASELVTGEHSGFKILPQQPADNPNLGPALTQTGINWAGSDNSRDPRQRQVGSALTVPRHPMNIFYNVATAAEEVAEYNWIYTSRANGGSGICEDNPATSTCLAAPLDPATAFGNYIVPLETRIAFSHVIANDPRPHYVHQSNLTEERIAYPVLEGVLGTYRGLFAANTPLVNQRLSALGAELKRQQAWAAAVAAGTVTGYVQDGKVVVSAPKGLDVPITAPNGTREDRLLSAPLFGQAYAGERSGYEDTTLLQPTIRLTLPSGTGY